MGPKPVQWDSNADLLMMSRVFSHLRDLLIELSLSLQDVSFQLDAELRDEANRQSRDVLDQIRRRQRGPSNSPPNDENLNPAS